MNDLKRKELEAKGIPVNTKPFRFNSKLLLPVSEITLFDFFLPLGLSDILIERFTSFESPFYPVGTQGLSDVTDGDIGSYRKTIYDENLAEYLSNCIMQQLPKWVELNEYSPVENNGKKCWELIGLSPLFRFMKYKENGSHNPHYDAPYIVDDYTQTLFSGVIYLTTNEVYTRCILDKQSNIPFSKRNTSDWSTTLEEAGNTVYAAKKSIKDTCFIFPHGICHDVSKNLEGKERIIIRFDILGTSYED